MKTDSDLIYSFVFKGLLTQEGLDNTPIIKKKNFTNDNHNDIIESLGINELDEDLVRQAQKMSIVYIGIAAFENSVRKFVTNVMLELYGEDWWTSKVSDGIRKKAESRREEERKIRWHTPRGDSIINYTEFGDLMAIMKLNWIDFQPHIVNQDWADLIIKTIERSRNVIMHSGNLENQDIERIGMNIRDWIKQVGT